MTTVAQCNRQQLQAKVVMTNTEGLHTDVLQVLTHQHYFVMDLWLYLWLQMMWEMRDEAADR